MSRSRKGLWLRQGQDALQRFINDLPELPKLGPDYATLDYHADALVVHRMRNKFQVPVKGANEARAQATVEKMLAYDASYKHTSWRELERDDRRHFLLARDFLHKALVGFQQSYTFRYPSNETYVSSNGDVSLTAKLANLEYWTVSADCIGLAAKIVYHNRSLRKVVRMHFRAKYPDTWRTLCRYWYSKAVREGRFVPYFVVSRMFRQLVTIVGVDRLAVVPKNNEWDREITLVPMWNMICQLSTAADLKRTVARNLGYDINLVAQINASRINDLRLATVDFSSASNSNWWSRVLELFPRRVTKVLKEARTGVVEWKGEYYPLNMMAPMGCGYTFEVMTLTLLAYARVLDPGATVFGDDVVISKEHAPRFAEFCERLGWVVNDKKSFFDGTFRESCGAFYSAGDGFILSYDFWYPEDDFDLTVIVNKIRRICVARQISRWLRERLIGLWIELVKGCPVGFCYPGAQLEGGYIEFERPIGRISHTEAEKQIARQLVGDSIQGNYPRQQTASLWTRRMHKVSRERECKSHEVGIHELVRLLQPGSATLVMREVRSTIYSCDVHGRRHNDLVLFDRIPIVV